MTIEHGAIGGFVGRGDITVAVVVMFCDAPGCSECFVALEQDCGDDGELARRAEREGWYSDEKKDYCPEDAR